MQGYHRNMYMTNFWCVYIAEFIIMMFLQAYLKFEQTSGDPARVQILYERAIAEFPISADLWLNYTEYLDRTLKVPLPPDSFFSLFLWLVIYQWMVHVRLQAAKVVKDVYCRATRNCPWVKELWVRYLLILERLHASEEDISAVSFCFFFYFTSLHVNKIKFCWMIF